MVSREARIEAIQVLIAEGWNPPLPPDHVVEKLAKTIRRLDLPRGATEGELRVLEAAARGLSAHKTAEYYGVSFETIKTQRRRAILRFGARNMTHAVALAWRQGHLR